MSEAKDSTNVPWVRQLDPNTLQYLGHHNGFYDAVRKDASLSVSGLKAAAKNHTVYKGHRWQMLDKSLDPAASHPVAATNASVRTITRGAIAQMDYKKTKITDVYRDQMSASAANGFKSRATLSTAVKTGKAAGRLFFCLWDDAPEALRNDYIARCGEPSFSEKSMTISCFDMKGEKVNEFESQQDVVKKLCIGHNKVREMLATGKPYQNLRLVRIGDAAGSDDGEAAEAVEGDSTV